MGTDNEDMNKKIAEEREAANKQAREKQEAAAQGQGVRFSTGQGPESEQEHETVGDEDGPDKATEMDNAAKNPTGASITDSDPSSNKQDGKRQYTTTNGYNIDVNTSNGKTSVSIPDTRSMSTADKVEIAKNMVAIALSEGAYSMRGDKPFFKINTNDPELRKALESTVENLGYTHIGNLPEADKTAQDKKSFKQYNETKSKEQQQWDRHLSSLLRRDDAILGGGQPFFSAYGSKMDHIDKMTKAESPGSIMTRLINGAGEDSTKQNIYKGRAADFTTKTGHSANLVKEFKKNSKGGEEKLNSIIKDGIIKGNGHNIPTALTNLNLDDSHRASDSKEQKDNTSKILDATKANKTASASDQRGQEPQPTAPTSGSRRN